jgi:hypothetical protein
MIHGTAILIVLLATLVFAGGAFANGCDTITLVIQTGSGGATVTGSSGVYSLSFGNVNGLGVGTLSPGVSVIKSGTGATYTTPITIKTTFANCPGGLQHQVIGVSQASTTTAKSQSSAREGASAGSVIAVPISPATGTTVLSVNGNISNQTVNRVVGLFVSKANGASYVSGALAPKFIYQVTVN